MSDDLPPSSNNPFIRFKRHVDARIGTGLSIFTGTSTRTDTDTGTDTATRVAPAPAPVNGSGLPLSSQPTPFENMDRAPKPPPSASASWFDSLLGWRDEGHDVNGATTKFWNEWAQLSPYSPYNLRHLPQPVPAGVSPEDADLFDFEDAFEDLLAVSSGRDLMDLRNQADRKRRILDSFHFGEPPMLWVNWLSARRLLPEPLPSRHMSETSQEMAAAEARWGGRLQGSYILKGIAEAHEQRLRMLEAQKSAFEDACSNTLERYQQWEVLKEKMIKGLDKDFTFNPAQMLRQAEEMIKGIDNAKDSSGSVTDPVEFDKFVHGEEHERSRSPGQKPQGQQKPAPDTEEDFYSALFGVLKEVNKSLSTNWTVEVPQVNDSRRPCKPSDPVEVVEHDENGGKTLTTSVEHVDMFGYVHRQTEVRKFDADGEQISCETKLIVRPAVETELRKLTDERETASSASVCSGENHTSMVDKGKSTGWFWR